ncbi:hypothetical protein NDN08_003849 [Rhodosorus marinus]|uniref:Uncharacterized protein n=1 Tax=Rhodosorus marinus TaxID=101924 RepID=A0AAV8UKC7_9RHOD|nr:hypothetical protein NDN08_003849 [Rhodosorus marinus]
MVITSGSLRSEDRLTCEDIRGVAWTGRRARAGLHGLGTGRDLGLGLNMRAERMYRRYKQNLSSNADRIEHIRARRNLSLMRSGSLVRKLCKSKIRIRVHNKFTSTVEPNKRLTLLYKF